MPINYTATKGKQAFPDKSKYLFNIDTLWLNIDSHYYDKVMDLGLREKLLSGRESLADSGKNQIISVKLEGYENEIKFEIAGAQPPQYQYSIRNDSMAIYFSKNHRENGSSMKIQINQFVLWEKGVERAYDEAKEVLKSLGFLPHSPKLNRVDFACHSDQFTWNLADFQKFEYPRNIKDDNKPNFMKLDPSTGEFGTVYYGSRERLALRIYNKSKEIKDKRKEYFNEIYREHDMDIDNIWNIEFECRRPFLKDLKNDDETFTDVYENFDLCLESDGLSRLWSLLMDKYSHNSAHWKLLAKGDKQRFKQIKQYNLTVKKDIDSNWFREFAQIRGRLMTAVLGEEDYTFENALEIFKNTLYEKERDEEIPYWHEDVAAKKSFILSNEINRTIKKDLPKRKVNTQIPINLN